MAAETQDRWTEIRRLHVDWKDGYRILGGVVLVGIGVVIGAGWFANPQADGYTTNLYTEFISIGVTVFILDFLNRRRDDRRRIEDLKAQLLRQVRSPEPAIANHAIHEMREQGWLEGEDGLLKGAKLWRANLHGADLLDANLHGADLRGTNLHGANLWGANLHGAILVSANLQGAKLVGTKFSKKTVLPDGKWDANTQQFIPYWTADTDMRRYTDPAHPDFWQPEWAKRRQGGGG